MRPISYFDRAARQHPDNIFLTNGQYSLTFSEADVMIDSIVAGLYADGFEPGDPVAVYSPNEPLAMLCVFATMRAGGAWVPVNSLTPPESNATYLASVGTRWIFFHSELQTQAEQVMESLSTLSGVVCIDQELEGYRSLEGYGQGLPAGAKTFLDPHGNPDMVFSLWPTGGTTGPSKAVQMTNGNITAMFELGIQYYVGGLPEAGTDIVYLAVAPITHAAGAIVPVFAAAGGTTIIHRGFDAAEVLRTIEEDRVTHFFLPPTAYYALLDHPDVGSTDLSSLRQILIAAAPISPDKFRRGVEVFGPVISQCYGQAEAPMLISMLSEEVVAAAARGEHPERLQSCGRVSSSMEVAILDADGNDVPRGERGEICCRGPLVTPGYFENVQATQAVRTAGWHHTGDVGYLDEHDFLYIVDRLKDMIITGGFNVFAAEVEAPILGLSEVLECAVVGKPDDHWGEAVVAYVVLNDGAKLSQDQVTAVVRAKLGPVKTPKEVVFCQSIPKTSNGKTDKKAIRAQFL